MRTERLSMSAGLIALKSDAEITMPSRTKSGSVPALIEFVPRMVRLRRLARLARAGEYREARNLPLQRLVEGGRGRGLDLFRLYGRDRSGDGSLFTHAVGDDHHVLERLRIALHFEVAGHLRPSVGDRVLHGLVTDVLEGQRGPGCDLNGIASVREGRDAARRAGNHVYPDQGVACLLRRLRHR